MIRAFRFVLSYNLLEDRWYHHQQVFTSVTLYETYRFHVAVGQLDHRSCKNMVRTSVTCTSHSLKK